MLTDTLEVSNGSTARYYCVVAEGLVAKLNADKEVVGFTMERAWELLLPHLREYDFHGIGEQRSRWNSDGATLGGGSKGSHGQLGKAAGGQELTVAYCKETDTLDLQNPVPVKDGEDVSADLVVFYGDADELVRFTLEHAAEFLLPCLSNGDSPTADITIGG
jgi:hypothetical protein